MTPYTGNKYPYDFSFFKNKHEEIFEMISSIEDIREMTLEDQDKEYFSQIFPTCYKKFESYVKKADSEELNSDEIKNDLVLQAEQDLEVTKRKFSTTLDLTQDQYKSLFETEQDPITYLADLLSCDPSQLLTHSEPLLCWWLNRNLPSLKPNSISNTQIKDATPIIYIYTERQTCLQCERTVQKSAYSHYFPFISFTEIYKDQTQMYESVKYSQNQLSLPCKDIKELKIGEKEEHELSFENIKNILTLSDPSERNGVRYPLQFSIESIPR